MTTRPAPAPAPAGLSLPHVVRAEAIKVTSLRSTWALLASAAAFTLLSGTLSALTVVVQDQMQGRPGAGAAAAAAGFDPVSGSVSGVGTFVFLVAVVGILQVTGELTTGLGRTTFAAVPRRGAVVAAKAVALALLAAPVAAVATAVTVVVAQGILGSRGLGVAVFSLDAAQVVAGAAGYAVAVGVVGQSLAWLVRSTAGAAFALLGLLGLVPSLLGLLLPPTVAAAVVAFLPGEAAAALMGADPTGGALSGIVALPVTLLWCAAAVLLAIRVLRRRDV